MSRANMMARFLLPACIVAVQYSGNVCGLGDFVPGLDDLLENEFGPLDELDGYSDFREQYTDEEWELLSLADRQTLMLQFQEDLAGEDKEGDNNQIKYLGLHYLKDFQEHQFNKTDPNSTVYAYGGIEWRHLRPMGCCRTQPGAVGISHKMIKVSFPKCQVNK